MTSMLLHRCYPMNNEDGEISAPGPKFQDTQINVTLLISNPGKKKYQWRMGKPQFLGEQ